MLELEDPDLNKQCDVEQEETCNEGKEPGLNKGDDCTLNKGDDCTHNQTDVEDEKTWDDGNVSQQNVDMDDARENTTGLNSDYEYFTLNDMHQPFNEEQDNGGHRSTHDVSTDEQPKVIK